MMRKKRDEEDEQTGGLQRAERLKGKARFKGGRRRKRDKTYGIDDIWFWRFFHRKRKPELGGTDGTEADIIAAYNEYLAQNKPKVK
jgi:hypothetical protein